MEKVSNQAGKNGIPSDWVAIGLCHKDEISEFRLDQDTARTGWCAKWRNWEVGGEGAVCDDKGGDSEEGTGVVEDS